MLKHDPETAATTCSCSKERLIVVAREQIGCGDGMMAATMAKLMHLKGLQLDGQPRHVHISWALDIKR